MPDHHATERAALLDPAGTSAGAVDLHGTLVRWTATGLPSDPAAALFSALPPSDTHAPNALTVTLRPARAEAARHPDTEGYRETCFLGSVRGFSRDDDFLLWDGASRVRADAAGQRIEADVAPPGSTDPVVFANVMLFTALAVALRHRGLFHLHAAAAIDPAERGWLIVGGSGSGKTSSTLALIASGFRYLGDDAAFLRQSPNGVVEALAFPRDFHVTDTTLAAFPALQPSAGSVVREGPLRKRAVDPRRAFPSRGVALATTAHVLLFPSVSTATATRVAPIAPADALSELLQSAPLVAAHAIPRRLEHLAALRALVDGARALEVHLGRDTLDRPARLAELVTEALDRPGPRG